MIAWPQQRAGRDDRDGAWSSTPFNDHSTAHEGRGRVPLRAAFRGPEKASSGLTYEQQPLLHVEVRQPARPAHRAPQSPPIAIAAVANRCMIVTRRQKPNGFVRHPILLPAKISSRSSRTTAVADSLCLLPRCRREHPQRPETQARNRSAGSGSRVSIYTAHPLSLDSETALAPEGMPVACGRKRVL